jgi:ribosomal protein L2
VLCPARRKEQGKNEQGKTSKEKRERKNEKDRRWIQAQRQSWLAIDGETKDLACRREREKNV